jgi:hypothetical protein
MFGLRRFHDRYVNHGALSVVRSAPPPRRPITAVTEADRAGRQRTNSFPAEPFQPPLGRAIGFVDGVVSERAIRFVVGHDAGLGGDQRGLRQRDHDIDFMRLLVLADAPAAIGFDGDGARHRQSDRFVRIDGDFWYRFELASVRLGTVCGNSTIGTPSRIMRCADDAI